MSFFNAGEKAYLEQTETISTFKVHGCWKNSFPKLTQFSQETMC
jgi:hypothetical protein